MSSKTDIGHNNIMKAKGLGGGGRTLNWTHHHKTWWSFFTEPGYLQFSLKDSLCVCKSVIYHSFVALFHRSKQGLFLFLFPSKGWIPGLLLRLQKMSVYQLPQKKVCVCSNSTTKAFLLLSLTYLEWSWCNFSSSQAVRSYWHCPGCSRVSCSIPWHKHLLRKHTRNQSC